VEETRRVKAQFQIRDLLADAGYSQAVPHFLSTTDVGGGESRPQLKKTHRMRHRSGDSEKGNWNQTKLPWKLPKGKGEGRGAETRGARSLGAGFVICYFLGTY